MDVESLKRRLTTELRDTANKVGVENSQYVL